MRRSKIAGMFIVVGLGLGCSSQPVETVGHNSAAASGAGPASVQLNGFLPPSGYVGVKLDLFEGVYNFDPAGAPHDDITLKVTVAGSYTLGPLDVFGYDPTWACSQDGATPVTVTCHADQITLKDTVIVPITPTALGSINVDARLTEGGVEVGRITGDIPIITPGADVALFGGGGGKLPLGQLGYANFGATNNGPIAATGTTATFALSGPGKIVSVGAGFPPPPPGFPAPPPPPPSGPTCTFTDTTATCPIGDLGVYGYLPINVVFQGTAEGVVAIDASIHANESDPVPFNTASSASYLVSRPKFADLAVSMTATPTAPKFKKPMRYDIVVKNNGPDAATGAILNDFLPPNVTFDTVTTTQGTCFGTSYVFCDLGPLPAGASATVSATGIPADGGTLSNSAYVYDPFSDTDIDLDPSNNFVSLTTTVSGPNPPVVTTSSEQKVETSFGAYVDCAHDFVVFTGTMHSSFHSTYNKSRGRLKFDSENHPSAMRGTGFDTGTKYTATGVTRSSQTFSGLPVSYDYQDVFHLIGKGPGLDLFLHVYNHVTFASDGTPKNTITKYTYTCR